MSSTASRKHRLGITGAAAASFLLAVALGWTVWSELADDLESPCAAAESCPGWDAVESGSAIPEAFHVLDREGDPIAAVAGPARMFVPLERLPGALIDGYVAVEDRRFWKSLGVDGLSIYRAAFANLVSGEVVSGASTIPMQLVRTIWANEMQDMGRWKRKLHELWIAPRLILRLGRERTLELYLNSVYLGDGVYGVEAAARHYFGVSAASLSLAETATLIGLTRTPGRYHPRLEPERSERRRDVVLAVMADQGIVDPSAAEQAAAQPLESAAESGLRRSRSYVTAAVTRELRAVAPELARLGGLRIHTTIDPAVQAAGESAIRRGLASIESGERGRLVERPDDVRLQAAGVAVDPASGAIRALIGGRDFGASEHDRATQARRPLGSLVKPFLLAAALENGAQLHDLVSTGPISFAAEGELWTPDDHVEEARVSMADMLALSSNRAAVRVGRSVGIERLQAVAGALGLDATVPPYPSAFLGAVDATLLDVVSAYVPFENGGRSVEPHLIERVRSRSGDLLYERERPAEGAATPIRPETSFLVREAMRGVITRGTGWRVSGSYPGPAAGKTGTTDGGRDAWFVGFVPGLAAGVWTGYDLPAPITVGGSGGSLAAPTWGDWMAAIDTPTADADWDPPAGIDRAPLHVATGMALPEACDAVFSGRLPRVWITSGAPRSPTCYPMARIETRSRMELPRFEPDRGRALSMEALERRGPFGTRPAID